MRINHALDNQPTLSSYDDGVTFNNKPPPPPTRLQVDESIMSVTKSMMENTSFSFVLFFLFLAAWNDLTDACFSRYIAMRVQNVSRTSRSSWKCTIRRCRLAGRCRLNAASFPTWRLTSSGTGTSRTTTAPSSTTQQALLLAMLCRWVSYFIIACDLFYYYFERMLRTWQTKRKKA